MVVESYEDDVPFRDWLRRELRARRMSLRQLAERSGVNASTVSRIMRGERRPTLRTALRLSRALQGTLGDAGASQLNSLASSADPVTGVERALRADAMLDDDQVREVMSMYLAFRRRQASAKPPGGGERRARGTVSGV
jgi:transcriptional regulator with XRE-family HTH domain